MFSRLPTKHRNNFYVQFSPDLYNTAGGDQDIPLSSGKSVQVLNEQRLKEVLLQYQKLKEHDEQLNAQIRTLTRHVNELEENKNTKKKLGSSESTSSIQDATRIIADLKTRLETTKKDSEESSNNLQKAREETRKVKADFDNLIQALSTTVIVNGPTKTATRDKVLSVTEILSIIREKLSDCVQMESQAMKEKAAHDTAMKAMQVELEKKLKEKDALLDQEVKRRQMAENSCKDSVEKAALDRTAKMESENRALRKSLDELKKQKTVVTGNITAAEKTLGQECAKNVAEIEKMLPYIDRQLEIWDSVSDSMAAKNNTNISFFVSTNKPFYVDAKKILQDYRTLDKKKCTDVLSIQPHVKGIYDKMQGMDTMLSNMFEDSAGAVRVYVRIRPFNKALATTVKPVLQKQGKSITYTGTTCSPNLPLKTYGRFFGVIPDSFKNIDVFTGCGGTTVTADGTFHVLGHDLSPQEIGRKGVEGTAGMCCIAGDSSGMCRSINQIKDGYHIVLFGYGYSGSGKTLTLLGDPVTGEPGLAHMALGNLPYKDVQLKSIFELTYGKIDFRSKTFNSGKVLDLFIRGERTVKNLPTEMFENHGAEFDKVLAKYMGDARENTANPLKTRSLKMQDMFALRRALDELRIQNGRIRPTPNNPQSSRSHLFITIEFQFEEGGKGYLTLIDMGGRESPTDILDMFLDKSPNQPWQITSMLLDARLTPTYIHPHRFKITDDSISWMIDKDRYGNNPAYRAQIDSFINSLDATSHDITRVIGVVKESVFINETVNQLMYFFKERQVTPGQMVDVKEMKMPLDEKNNPYDPMKFLMGKPTATEKMGMYRILGQLEKMYSKPSKFVMICNVRQESSPVKFCQSTRDTLEFAQSIRST
jgi:hypothetical protein